MWKCVKCNEEVDDNFTVCWNCQAEKDTGLQTSDFHPPESKELREQISNLSDVELSQMVNEVSRVSDSDPFRIPTINFGNDRKEEFNLMREELLKRGLSQPEISKEKTSQPIVSSYVSSLMKRYNDAYLVARITSGLGKLIKVFGFVMAIVIALLGIMFIGDGDSTGKIIGTILIVFGVIEAAWSFIIGVIVSAQGQILKAALDGAVNGSPFLTNEHRAKIMSL